MKNVVITILSILVIGLSGYIIYDKLIDNKDVKNDDKQIQQDLDKNVEKEKSLENSKTLSTGEKILSYEKYLRIFALYNNDEDSCNNFKDIDKMKWYIFRYYQRYGSYFNATGVLPIEVKVSEDDLKTLIYNVYGIEENDLSKYILDINSPSIGLHKAEDGSYKITYKGSSDMTHASISSTSIKENENNIVVSYNVLIEAFGEAVQTFVLDFYLVPNGDKYYIEKIERKNEVNFNNQ
ncbi:MAG: hypothetical protein Q4E75_03135 [bacterium]|nr:hypothetical protein [bacterium]